MVVVYDESGSEGEGDGCKCYSYMLLWATLMLQNRTFSYKDSLLFLL